MLAFFGGGLGGGEVLILLLVLLLLFGARRLPELARALGRALEEFRHAADRVTRDVMEEPPAANHPQEPPQPPEPSAGERSEDSFGADV